MYSVLFFSTLFHEGSVGMPARILIPVLFAAGILIQSLLLRAVKGGKRFYLIYTLLGIIVLCETVGRLDNGLAEIIAVAFTWAILSGALLALAVYGLISLRSHKSGEETDVP